MNVPDYRLSMQISRRPRTDTEGLRTLLIHRLRPPQKAVWRWSLQSAQRSVHCEPCRRWFHGVDAAEAWDCPGCGRKYVAEVVIYTEMRSES